MRKRIRLALFFCLKNGRGQDRVCTKKNESEPCFLILTDELSPYIW